MDAPEGCVGTRRGGDRAQFARAPYQSVPQHPGGAPAPSGLAQRRDLYPSRISRVRRVSCSIVNGFSMNPVPGGMIPSTVTARSLYPDM